MNLLERYKERLIEEGESKEPVDIVIRVQCWVHEDLKRAKAPRKETAGAETK